MQIYSDLEVLQTIYRLFPEWFYDRENISREFKFDTYLQSIEFVNQVATIAEELNHHPLIQISWCKVLIKLQTHSKIAITSLDFDLASRLDKLFISFLG